ncbi:MAG: hypothetical protein C4586_07165 [Anaerolineaceae bacterium]|nr:MAG: hypothetical protein C4586_07165 [Anaerolineaceae bacterium]
MGCCSAIVSVALTVGRSKVGVGFANIPLHALIVPVNMMLMKIKNIMTRFRGNDIFIFMAFLLVLVRYLDQDYVQNKCTKIIPPLQNDRPYKLSSPLQLENP